MGWRGCHQWRHHTNFHFNYLFTLTCAFPTCFDLVLAPIFKQTASYEWRAGMPSWAHHDGVFCIKNATIMDFWAESIVSAFCFCKIISRCATIFTDFWMFLISSTRQLLSRGLHTATVENPHKPILVFWDFWNCVPWKPTRTTMPVKTFWLPPAFHTILKTFLGTPGHPL